MKLIVGLGNPGKKYENTRHNIGFRVLDSLREKLGFSEWKLEPRYKAEVAEGDDVLLVKPQTFMNLSGQSVWPFKKFYKIDSEDILLVYDDMAFPLAALKIRKGGSAGGHNGIRSVIDALGTDNLPRVRIGIGESGQKEAADHVLSKFTPKEQELIADTVSKAIEAIEIYLKKGISEAMNSYN